MERMVLSDTISSELIRDLEGKAKELRRRILRVISRAGAGHPGGSLSAIDILVTLYFGVMDVDPKNPTREDRDRFVLSKGHASAALYAVLAEKGYFPAEILSKYDQINSPLQGHPDMTKVAGVDISTGSLGQGLSVGVGMALGARLRGKSFKVYVMLGDGECQEGQVWEAAMSAGHYRLDNLIAILDNNKVQLYGKVADLMGIEPLRAKWEAFGWEVIEADGHDIASLISAFVQSAKVIGKPKIIIAETVKGKGVSFMEGQHSWHGKAPSERELEVALSELS